MYDRRKRHFQDRNPSPCCNNWHRTIHSSECTSAGSAAWHHPSRRHTRNRLRSHSLSGSCSCRPAHHFRAQRMPTLDHGSQPNGCKRHTSPHCPGSGSDGRCHHHNTHSHHNRGHNNTHRAVFHTPCTNGTIHNNHSSRSPHPSIPCRHTLFHTSNKESVPSNTIPHRAQCSSNRYSNQKDRMRTQQQPRPSKAYCSRVYA